MGAEFCSASEKMPEHCNCFHGSSCYCGRFHWLFIALLGCDHSLGSSYLVRTCTFANRLTGPPPQQLGPIPTPPPINPQTCFLTRPTASPLNFHQSKTNWELCLPSFLPPYLVSHEYHLERPSSLQTCCLDPTKPSSGLYFFKGEIAATVRHQLDAITDAF